MPRTRLLIPVTLVLAAFALPAAASASFQSRIVTNNHVNLTGSDNAESIVIGSDVEGRLTHDQTSAGFASALDFDTTTPGTQSVKGLSALTIDGEGGNDRIDVKANVRLFADGGEGYDIIYGSSRADVIQGGTDGDYVDGRGAEDAIYLGSGDDRYAFAPKTSGPDSVDGGDGDDEASGSGTAADETVTVSHALTAIRVAMTGGSPVLLTGLETISLDLGAGDDEFRPEMVFTTPALVVNGGAGMDSLYGDVGPDRLDGGDGYDFVDGRLGDDILAGEDVRGGAGNDRMTLEGSSLDVNAAGQSGYDLARVRATAADDELFVVRKPTVVWVHGDAGGQSFVAQASSEALMVETGGGDDTATVLAGAGAASAIVVNGGSGNDLLRGSDAAETLHGTRGDDIVDGGLGPDRLSGGTDSDVIRARDGRADTIGCDTGDDVVFADLEPLDVIDDGPDCEAVQRGAAPGAFDPLARVAATGELSATQGEVRVPVTCLAPATCQVTVTITTAEPVSITGFTVPVLLGRSTVTMARNTTLDLPIPLTDSADLVRAAGGARLPVQVQVSTASGERTVTLPLQLPG